MSSQKLSASAVSGFMLTVLDNPDAATARGTLGAAALSHGHNIADIANLHATLDAKLSANWVAAGGSADAITANYAPAITSLVDGQLCFFRATAPNATAIPTFSPNGLPACTITRLGGSPLIAGDIPAQSAEVILRHSIADTRWELLNPAPTIWSTGDIKATIKNTADSGWLMLDDTTIGSAASGATHAGSQYQALYLLLWSNMADAYAPVTGGRGASASADWNANKPIALLKVLGRSFGAAGAGAGLTSRSLGQTLAEEAHLLTSSEMPSHYHNVYLNDPGHTHTYTATSTANAGSGVGTVSYPGGTGNTGSATTGMTVRDQAGGGGNANRTATAGSNAAHNNMQPTVFTNWMIKL